MSRDWNRAMAAEAVRATIAAGTARCTKSYAKRAGGSDSDTSTFLGEVDFRTRSGHIAPARSLRESHSDEQDSDAVLIWHGTTFFERDGFWWRVGKSPRQPVPPGDPDGVLDLVGAAGTGRQLMEGHMEEGAHPQLESRYAVVIDLAAGAANSPQPNGGVAGSIRRLNSIDLLPAELRLDDLGRVVRFSYDDPTSLMRITVEYDQFDCPVDISPPEKGAVRNLSWRALARDWLTRRVRR